MANLNIPQLKERRRELRRSSTTAEKVLWEELRKKKLGIKFYRQYSVGGYVLDFYCSKFRLAVEVDGGYHEETDIKEADNIRTAFLTGHGVIVLRFKNEEMFENMEDVLKKIKRQLRSPLC